MTVTIETFRTHSAEETYALGSTLAARLGPGTTLVMRGELGSGKTTFVRGLASGLGIDPNDVSSPTFVLIQSYRSHVTLHHVDLYRLARAEIEDLGLDELESSQGVVAIEWGDRLPRPIPGAVDVQLTDHGGDEREITISYSVR